MSEQEIIEKSTYLTADQLLKISGRSKEELLVILSRHLERDWKIQALSMSGVVSGAKQLCPKCSGQGIVSKPPYIAGDQNEWTCVEVSYKCNLCDGRMVI